MPRKKETAGRYSMDDYRLKQVDIRLKLMEGPSCYSQTPSNVVAIEDVNTYHRNVTSWA